MNAILIRLFGIFVVLGTLCAFLLFAYMHPRIADNLTQTTISTIFIIVVMYAGSVCSLAFVLTEALRFYNKYVYYSECILLTAYSTLANFFGPGQSGIGVRAVYLKVKHGISFKHFLFTTCIYFCWLILISGTMLIAFTIPWWLAYAYLAIAASACALLIWLVAGPDKIGFVPLDCKPRLTRLVLTTGIGTALQIAFITAAYFAELCAVDSGVRLSQAISFTGAANFSLFVSITPGSIGIREAFLFLSQNIHGVSVETIAMASALDRAVYFIVLALLGLLVLFTHAGLRFGQSGEAKSQDNS